MDKESEIIKQIEDSIELKRQLETQAEMLVEIAKQIIEALRRGNKVLLFGNGGSAADAQHIAAELGGKFYLRRQPLPAIALNTNTSTLTAIANDYGYEEVFARQVKALVNKGDIVIGISTSGSSPNILQGLAAARQYQAVTVAFSGQGGNFKGIVDFVLEVPSLDTPRIQEVHILAGHIICYLVEEALFGGNGETK